MSQFAISDRPFAVASINVCDWDGLTPHQLERWREIRASRDDFAPPFFAPEFAEAVQRARGDVHVAVLMNHVDQIVGFFPFHRRRVGWRRPVGVPVGRFLNDAHNVIAESATTIDWHVLARQCGVVGFDMHAMVGAPTSTIQSNRLQMVRAYRADMEGDSEAYFQSLRRQHRTIDKQGQKTRKMSREVGDVRLEIDCRDPAVLAKAIAWKRAQYQRTHILDLFVPDWTRRLVDELHQSRVDAPAESLATEPLRGMLSVLWAGDDVAAAHVGMIERGRLHYWFPTYDPQFGRYSPGTALFIEVVRASTQFGIDTIDMGYGEQPYKQKQTATTSEVVFGTITESPVHRLVHDSHATFVTWLKKMPMKETVKAAWRSVNPNAGMGKIN